MIEPVLPIAIYILFGYLYKVLFQDNSRQLVDFVIYFSLPAIVFSKIYPEDKRQLIMKGSKINSKAVTPNSLFFSYDKIYLLCAYFTNCHYISVQLSHRNRTLVL